METNTDIGELNNEYILYLKSKGISNCKISEMLGIPKEEIDIHIQFNEALKEFSGVF